MSSHYRICSRCVMDTTDPEIQFDSGGVCNHCKLAEHRLEHRLRLYQTGTYAIGGLVESIKSAGKGKPYDCVVGVSGGVDSTYVAYLAKTLHLRPLAVHFDNGWDSELAVRNIERALKVLDIDLYTYVVNWDEFRDIQFAFLMASVPDIEIPTDHAIHAVLYQTATRHGIKFVLTGTNLATESILPISWAYGHCDWKYIRALHKRFGKGPVPTYPHYTLPQMGWYFAVRRIKTVSILNCVNYNKSEALKVMTDKLGWENYGSKHHESIITRFLQTYILPNKFGIDKRRAHLSSLIVSGQLSRSEACEELKKPVYDSRQLGEDLAYVSKKFGVSEKEFAAIMNLPIRSFRNYPNGFKMKERLRGLMRVAQQAGFLPAQVGM